LREEIVRLRNDNVALTGGMAEATRRVEVKKEFTEATVDRLQKVRLDYLKTEMYFDGAHLICFT